MIKIYNSQLSRDMVELLLDHDADVDVENVGEMLQRKKRPFNMFTYPFDSSELYIL